MKIPDETIEEIKYRNPIEEIIASYVTLKRAGSNLVGLCPFHSEKSPSFTVFLSGDPHFYCFGCGAGGDVVTFIRRIENLSYVEALRFLGRRVGIDIPEDGEGEGETGVRRQRILDMNRDAARFYHKALCETPEAMEYLTGRGLTGALIKHFGLGFAPDSFGALTDHLSKLGYTAEEMTAGFLCGKSKKNGRPYDYFRGRVIFPIINTSGEVIAFGGRIIKQEGGPKYLNSSDTPAFKKSRNLFALNFARNCCQEQMILCEGYMDVVTLHGAGFPFAVATLGTAITPEQARIMKHYTKKVIISYDSDEAGQKAADKAFRLLGETGVETRVLRMEGAKDPDEYIRKFGADKFKRLLEGSFSQFDFKLEGIRRKYDLSITDEKVKAAQEISRILSEVPSSVERELYCAKAAEALGITAENLKRDVAYQIKRRTSENKREELKQAFREVSDYGDRINPEALKNLRAARTEEDIIGILLLYPERIKEVSSLLAPDDFMTAFHRRVYENMLANGHFDSSEFSVEEIGRLTRLKIAREKLTENGLEILQELIRVLKDEKCRGSADLEELIRRKRDAQ